MNLQEESVVTLCELLEVERGTIVAQAAETLACRRLAHYGTAGPQVNTARLQTLFDRTVSCLRTRNLGPLLAYTEQLARERFTAGYELAEVQMAFNALEEAIWQAIIASWLPAELGAALGLVSTVHGAAKDTLARAYVALAAERRAPALNLDALFEGTESAAKE